MKPEVLARVIRRYRLAKKLAVIREAAKPMEGPYYWFPSKDGWELLAYYDEVYPDIIHDEAWRKSVVHRLGEEWGLSREQLLELRKWPYALPRGRISGGLGTPVVFYLNHGNDTPIPEGLDKVMSEFHLWGLQKIDKLKVVYDNHERMIPQHHHKLVSMIPEIGLMF
jgi:hypothetical protein